MLKTCYLPIDIYENGATIFENEYRGYILHVLLYISITKHGLIIPQFYTSDKTKLWFSGDFTPKKFNVIFIHTTGKNQTKKFKLKNQF